ncbi:MAG: DUF935 domain-containing protein, partial [Burkholderiaceae bacterium]|nr:DUF935 domain-containing protein [Burkholderiaceae bacterium]
MAAASKERQNVRQDLTQADSDLLSETLNSTLLAWLCELNGLAPCQVWRQIQEESDQKTLAEADKAVYDMGFELSEDVVRARYGEGWSRRADASLAPLPDPPPTGGGNIAPSPFLTPPPLSTSGEGSKWLPPPAGGGSGRGDNGAEGWGEGASPAPGRQPPNFAERDATPTLLLPRPLQGGEGGGEGVDALSDPLDATSANVIGQWLNQLRAAVNAYDDPQQLQDALLAQFGALPERDLTELMALAFELAHLKGREAALTDNSPLPSPPPQGGGSGDGGSVLLPPPSSPPAPLH